MRCLPCVTVDLSRCVQSGLDRMQVGEAEWVPGEFLWAPRIPFVFFQQLALSLSAAAALRRVKGTCSFLLNKYRKMIFFLIVILERQY